MGAKINRIGECNINTRGSKMTITEYINTNNIVVQFDNGHSTKTTYHNFINGTVGNLYEKISYNIGFIGEGNYKTRNNDKDKLPTKQYTIWKGMLQRCYDSSSKSNRSLSYINCTVAEEWHNFQNFAKWYDKNYYVVNNETMCIDKDILIKNNKVYSPETCIFVPFKINALLIKEKARRGKYPIGVTKSQNRYIARCHNNDGGKIQNIGSFSTPELAFNAYKIYKEKLIKQIADKYKEKIPKKLYDALYKYEVEITD